MQALLKLKRPDLHLIASSGQSLGDTTRTTLLDFSPYVASINAAGQVAFQAAYQQGGSKGTGIFCGDGDLLQEFRAMGEAEAVAPSGAKQEWQFTSHPAINDDGVVSVYAEARDGQSALLLWRAQQWSVVSRYIAGSGQIGPLGPTMNAAGMVAFRAQDGAGLHGVYLFDGNRCHLLANFTHGFTAFHGLPVVNGDGDVLFRADQAGGRQVICLVRAGRADCMAGQYAVLADNAGEFADLALFPMLDDLGRVIFVASRKTGGAGIYVLDAARRGMPEPLLDSGAVFQSLRGALIHRHGPQAFFATPHGGALGIYRFAREPDGLPKPVMVLGDTLFDSQVVGFALNPVSCNVHGQLAIRVALADGRALIVRADPS